MSGGRRCYERSRTTLHGAGVVTADGEAGPLCTGPEWRRRPGLGGTGGGAEVEPDDGCWAGKPVALWSGGECAEAGVSTLKTVSGRMIEGSESETSITEATGDGESSRTEERPSVLSLSMIQRSVLLPTRLARREGDRAAVSELALWVLAPTQGAAHADLDTIDLLEPGLIEGLRGRNLVGLRFRGRTGRVGNQL